MLDRFRPVASDASRVAGLAAGWVVAAVVPQRADGWVIDRVGSLLVAAKRSGVGRLAEKIDDVIGPAESGDSLERAKEIYRLELESGWGRARGLHRRGWQPEITLEGQDALERAREAGRGVILWRMQFCSSPIAKRALAEAGYPLVHLGAPGHGTKSRGLLALDFLEPMIRRSEDWYLEERVMVRNRQSVSYAKTLMDRLEDNRVVMIFGDLWGLHPITVPFLGGQASFATGAPSLAWRTGAELLTLRVVREGTLRYRVVIDEPIEPSRDGGRKAYVEDAVHEFVRRLELAVRAHPSSWNSWNVFLGGYRPFGGETGDDAPEAEGSLSA